GSIGHIFPNEQILILAHRVFYKRFTKLGFAGASVLVDHTTGRRQQRFPASFPCLIRQIGVFQVERMIKGIESAKDKILFPVDGARAAAGPEHWDLLRRLLVRCKVVMPQIRKSVLEPASSLAGFFSSAGCIREKNLRCDGENERIGKAI